MSNSIAISPQVMINRIVDRAGTPGEAQLGKVAELSLALQRAITDEQAQAELLSPTGQAEAPVVDSGAMVDRLI